MSERCDLPGAKNLQMHVDKAVLYLYCNLSQDCGASSSGKSVLIGSSSGNKPLGKSGAFLGLNIYTKSLEARDLSEKALEPLLTGEFEAIGDGCQWRMEEDSVTLCIKVDFEHVKVRLGGSGKSMLLATTGGNKQVASSGIYCGLNCYHPVNEKFQVSLLGQGMTPEEAPKVGNVVELKDGFTVTYASVTEVRVKFTYAAEVMADGHVAAMPPYRMGELTLNFLVGAVKAARARKETTPVAASQSPPPASQSPASSTSSHGDVLVEEGKEDRIRNVTVSCTPATDGAVRKGEEDEAPDTYVVECVFDPTKHLNRSSSAKSLMVATTGGYQRVVDRAGRAVCRLSLNVYKPGPPIEDEEIAAAVESALSPKLKEEVAAMPFKDVLAEVAKGLGIGEATKDALKPRVKAAVMTYMQKVMRG